MKKAAAALETATATLRARAETAEAARDSLSAQVVSLSSKNSKLEATLQAARETDKDALLDLGVVVGINNLRFESSGIFEDSAPLRVAPNHICSTTSTQYTKTVTCDPVEFGLYDQTFYIKGGGSVLAGLVSEEQVAHAMHSPHTEYFVAKGKYSRIPPGQLRMAGISPNNSGTALLFKIDMHKKTAVLYATDEACPGHLKEAHVWNNIPSKVYIAIAAKRGDYTPDAVPREIMAMQFTHHKLVPFVTVPDGDDN